MINTSNKYLLQIEPKNKKSIHPSNDSVTRKMERLLESAKKGKAYKGTHKCVCGIRSTSYDLFIRGYITNSLAVHYLRWHRNEVPRLEIEKVKNM